MSDSTGEMVSRAIPNVPDDPGELGRFLAKVLRAHYQDIKTLFPGVGLEPDMDKITFFLAGVQWRLRIVGDDLQIQKLVGDTWTEAFTIKGS